jgi:ABC-type dipeptide/oligopeptide/nickel transport system permease subunit
MPTPPTTPSPEPAVVTGVQLMQGIGARPAKGFWADAWDTVAKRPTAIFALSWLGLMLFLAVFGPLLASGHPLWVTLAPTASAPAPVSFSPLWRALTSLDLALLALALFGTPYVLFGGASDRRAARLGHLILLAVVTIIIIAASGLVQGRLIDLAEESARRAQTVAARTGQAPEFTPPFVRRTDAGFYVATAVAVVLGAGAMLLPVASRSTRAVTILLACGLAVLCVGSRFNRPADRYDYLARQDAGRITSATYTLVPWSPLQRFSELSRKPPGTTFGPATGRELTLGAPGQPATTPAGYHQRFVLGTDAFGSDVLSQLIGASRLSISIGLVSTSIALLIGVTMGALMGYFGGWVDLILFRVVEVFMAVPVLFLLIVAVAVLPEELRTPYVIMAIIGCFTWTGMARFTRAEFMKLRNQDFVQAAQATGLPLSSILFKHMLPNGVAPVLVDTSFAVASAIGIEATLSYLGLGPSDSSSWGKLLASAISTEGEFKWWLAVFPGGAIFITVLSYNLLGEALRDAIDPKLKKARV